MTVNHEVNHVNHGFFDPLKMADVIIMNEIKTL